MVGDVRPRDAVQHEMHAFEMMAEDGHMLKCIQCPTLENCWKEITKDANNDEEVLGFFMV
eukprot:7428273-Prorocentrum_lima.AAC.1